MLTEGRRQIVGYTLEKGTSKSSLSCHWNGTFYVDKIGIVWQLVLSMQSWTKKYTYRSALIEKPIFTLMHLSTMQRQFIPIFCTTKTNTSANLMLSVCYDIEVQPSVLLLKDERLLKNLISLMETLDLTSEQTNLGGGGPISTEIFSTWNFLVPWPSHSQRKEFAYAMSQD